MLDATGSGDADAYFAALAALDVYVPCRLDDAEAVLAGTRTGGSRYVTRRLKGAVSGTTLDVFTRGALPRRPGDTFFDHTMWAAHVRWLAGSQPDWTLVVNRGTPLERRVGVREAAAWLEAHPRTVGTWEALKTRLRTVWNEPVSGPLARALACGGHLSVMNGVPWNTVGHDRLDFENERKTIREWWGLTNAAQWREQTEILLDQEAMAAIDVVLALRRDASGERAPDPDPDLLRTVVSAWCREQEDLPEEAVADLTDVAEWVGRCEAWMRRDGLLPADGVVLTQAAWDLGRAVHMGRWGLSCGFCDRGMAERIIMQAGAECARLYTGWLDLSAAYVLGRVVKMGRQGSPEETYRQSRAVHETLVADPASPWRNLPLR